jgi:amino acid transporter
MSEVAEQRAGTTATLDSEGMDRGVGFFGLLWSSEGSLIGSGWLFGALTAATIAGPSALIAWGIATLIMLVLALIHAELGGLFPVSGGTSRFPHYAFGSLAGGTFGWFSFLQAATVAPIEVLAVIQYASSYSWAKSWYTGTSLHGPGIPVAIALLFVAVIINIVGVRWFARINNVFTVWKVLIPILAIIVLLVSHPHWGNFSSHGFFVHQGGVVKNILIAIPAGGIVFSLLGFEQAVQLAGEARNPKDVPRAVILSLLIGGALYIIIQVAFIATLEPSLLAQAHTWTNLGPTNHNSAVMALNSAPFYDVAKVAGIAWLAVVLRLDSSISPGGTALIYTTSSSRLLFGLSRNGYLPKALETTALKSKAPWLAIIVAGVIGVLFLLPFPSWNKLVNVVTDASVMMYAGAPLAMGALRKQKPNLPRTYRMPAGQIMAPVGFVLASLIIYWTGWGTYSTLMAAMIIGYVVMGVSAALGANEGRGALDLRSGFFVFPYMIGMGIISYLGQFARPAEGLFRGSIGGGINHDLVGGTGAIPFYWDMLIVVAFSLAIYHLALHFRLPESEVDQNVREVYPTEMPAE